jgi:hypothetical protein
MPHVRRDRGPPSPADLGHAAAGDRLITPSSATRRTRLLRQVDEVPCGAWLSTATSVGVTAARWSSPPSPRASSPPVPATVCDVAVVETVRIRWLLLSA